MSKPHIDIADLVRRSQAMAEGLAKGMPGYAGGPPDDGRLREVAGFGSNPGGLRMLEFVPDRLPPGAPLVVVLHGCSQSAGGYDRGTGWSTLAARRGFALLLPEQRVPNNANRCFNWFEPRDTRRDQGEALSIRQMVAHMASRHRLDPRRVYVTGLSAGGAMTSVMLATWPEVFSAGAIIAGLPYGAAQSMPEAFEAMATGHPRPAGAWGELVRRASPHRGPWPRVSVWQGEADATVRPANAAEIVKQWRDLHGLSAAPDSGPPRGPAHRHGLWRGPDGSVLLEHHAISGMAHGVPIAPRLGAEPLGEAAPWILDMGIPSTEAIAEFFGLGAAVAEAERVIAVGRDGAARVTAAAPAAEAPTARPVPAGDQAGAEQARPAPRRPYVPERPAAARPAPPIGADRPAAAPQAAAGDPPRRSLDPGGIIKRALRAAGLMRG